MPNFSREMYLNSEALSLVLAWFGFVGEIKINCILECGWWDIEHCVNQVKTIYVSKPVL